MVSVYMMVVILFSVFIPAQNKKIDILVCEVPYFVVTHYLI